MSLTEVLNKIVGRQSARKVERMRGYDDLVVAVHAGTEPDEDQIETILGSAGKTCDDLTRDVQRIVDRRKRAAKLSEEPELVRQHNDTYAELEVANSQHIAAVRRLNEKHAERVGELQQRLAAIATERDKCQTARNMLTRTSPHHDRLTKLSDELATLQIALQSRLPRQQRQEKSGDAGWNASEIARTQLAADQLAAEIAQLEREALQP